MNGEFEPSHVCYHVWSSTAEVTTLMLPALNQSKCRWASPALCGLDIHILLCYILQPQQRRHGDWMPPSLCQKAAVSSTILVFQKYGLPRRRRAAGRAGRAEWHSWFPVLWADYCWLFPTACPYSRIYSTDPAKLFLMTDVNQFESMSQTHRGPPVDFMKCKNYWINLVSFKTNLEK